MEQTSQPPVAPPAPAFHGDPAEVVGRRIVAALLDILVLAILFVVMGVLFGDSKADDGEASVNLEGGAAFLYFAIVLGYYIVAEAVWGKTLGKRLMGLRVAKLDGSAPGTGGSLVRNLLRIVDSLPFLYLIGLIVMLVTEKKQRIGDLAASTVVIRDA